MIRFMSDTRYAGLEKEMQHWFHTKEQMDFISDWIKQYI